MNGLLETEGRLPPVPARYRGVWVRRLLATPSLRDETTFVRWLQTAGWHADLRVPDAARPGLPVPAPGPADALTAGQRLALQQGFCGRTTVEVVDGQEVCTWHRRHDFQPPRPDPDAGRIEFDGPDRMIEFGVHSPYEEVWERLPGSAGRSAVFVQAAPADAQDTPGALLLIAGRFAMRVRPRAGAWPSGTTTDDTLLDLVRRHTALQPALLDFEISFGPLDGGHWTIERSTLPQREGMRLGFHVRRDSVETATIVLGDSAGPWRIVEWHGADGDASPASASGGDLG